MGLGRRLSLHLRKNDFFYLEWRVLVHSERYFFVRVLARKMLVWGFNGGLEAEPPVGFGGRAPGQGDKGEALMKLKPLKHLYA